MPYLTDEQWKTFKQDGFVKLGKLLSDSELAGLQQRIDDIMLGKASLDYDKIMMQLDSSSGKYEDAGVQSRGFKGPTLDYRKIQDLEFDPLFLQYMQRPVFCEICAKVYGPDTPITCMRAMFMNKPARKGTWLPWHQDRWTNFDRDPQITLWLALDPATIANGAVQLIPGSHVKLYNPSHPSGFLTPEQAKEICTPEKRVYLELQAGEVALLHNYTLHSSDVNKTDIPRRAFSVCYMDGNTKDVNGHKFTTIFGDGALTVADLQPAAVA